MKNNHLLTISMFSKITGISRKNLIYYDSIGLLKPELYGENGYRYYSIKQIELSYIIMTLKTLKLSLEEIHNYLQIRSPEEGLNLFKDQLIKAESDIQYLYEIKRYLQYRIKTTQECFTVNLDTPFIQEEVQELFYISESPVPNETTYDAEVITEFYDKLISINAFINYSFGFIYKNISKKSSFTDDDYICYLTLRTTHFDVNHPQIIKPKSSFLVMYHSGTITDFKTAIQPLLDFALAQNIKLHDTAYYEVLWDEVVSKRNENQICKLSIKIVND